MGSELTVQEAKKELDVKDAKIKALTTRLAATDEATKYYSARHRQCRHCKKSFGKGDLVPFGTSLTSVSADEYRVFMGPTDYCLSCIRGDDLHCEFDKNVALERKQLHHHEGTAIFQPLHEIKKTKTSTSLRIGGCFEVGEKERISNKLAEIKYDVAKKKAETAEKSNKLKRERAQDELDTARKIARCKRHAQAQKRVQTGDASASTTHETQGAHDHGLDSDANEDDEDPASRQEGGEELHAS